jgi:hypothetical protein
VIGMFELTRAGTEFEAENRWSFMASRDAWQAPVQVKVGPDGAVWVSDFYSLVAQHNPTPEGMELGEGNAYETPNRDKVHGRIYRIVHDEAPASATTSLADATPQRLVEALSDDNLFWRLTAQQLLVERGETDVVPALIALVDDQTIDALGLNAGALHALWTLDGLDAVTTDPQARESVRRALHHPAAAVRRAAIEVLPKDQQLLDDIFAAGMLPDRTSPHDVEYTVPSGVLQDADAQVRLAALLALSEVPASPRAAQTIVELMTVPRNARDQWLPDAAAIAGVQQGVDVALALLDHRTEREDSAAAAGVGRTVRLMTEHFADRQDIDAVLALLQRVPQANPIAGRGVLVGIAGEAPDEEGRQRGGEGRWPPEAPPALTPAQRTALAEVAGAMPRELASDFARVAARLGVPDLAGGR